jgi:outer membrane protein OmpA-like peptidoglycan-associated protein
MPLLSSLCWLVRTDLCAGWFLRDSSPFHMQPPHARPRAPSSGAARLRWVTAMISIDDFKKAFAGKAAPDLMSQRDKQVTAALKNFNQALGGAALEPDRAKAFKDRLVGLVQRFDKAKKSRAPDTERLTEFDDILRQANTGVSAVKQSVAGAGTPAGVGSPSKDSADNCVTPDATGSDYFFDKDSPKLTASDKTFLEAYAKAYLAQNVDEKITVTGYASIEGDKSENAKLSQNRANEVARYLSDQKVPKDKVNKPVGKGATQQFSESNYCLNRRVTITPVLNLKVVDFVEVVETEPRNVPTGKKPDLSLGTKAEEPDIANIHIPEPCPMVSRDVVEQTLTEWLIALGKAQKLKTRETDMVMTTARVNLAEQTLLGKTGADGDTREGPHGTRCGREELEQMPITPFNGDETLHEAAVLAKQITQGFPKRLAHQNLLNLLKLKPVEAPVELSLGEQVRAKADSLANQVLSDFQVPKKYWGKIKDFVKDKIPDAIDKLPISDKEKELAKKAYKKLANIKDDKDEK